MRSMHPVLLKQKRLRVASEGDTVEIRVSQFIRQWVPSCWHSHGKGTTTIPVQLELWKVFSWFCRLHLYAPLSICAAQSRRPWNCVTEKTHTKKLYRRRSIRKYAFANGVIERWNSPSECRINSTSVNLFETHLSQLETRVNNTYIVN